MVIFGVGRGSLQSLPQTLYHQSKKCFVYKFENLFIHFFSLHTDLSIFTEAVNVIINLCILVIKTYLVHLANKTLKNNSRHSQSIKSSFVFAHLLIKMINHAS